MTERNDHLKTERRSEEKQLIREALKEGMRSWLDDQFAILGRWTLRGMGAMGFFLLIYFWLSAHGWKAPPIAP
jgi:hypothetical protein